MTVAVFGPEETENGGGAEREERREGERTGEKE